MVRSLRLLLAVGIEHMTTMEVLVFGSMAMDLIATVPTHPKKNTTMAALQLETKHGGKGVSEPGPTPHAPLRPH
jgi:hypothetical protein